MKLVLVAQRSAHLIFGLSLLVSCANGGDDGDSRADAAGGDASRDCPCDGAADKPGDAPALADMQAVATPSDAAPSDAAASDSDAGDPEPHQCRITDNAHLDLLSIRRDDEHLVVTIDHANYGYLLDPRRTTVQLLLDAKTTLPPTPPFPFLAEPLSHVWHLDAGWSVRGITSGWLKDDSMQIVFEAIEGPSAVAVWRVTGQSIPEAFFTSKQALPQSETIGHRAHTHANWSFAAPGTYKLVFRVTAVRALDGQAITSEPVSLRFNVIGPQ